MDNKFQGKLSRIKLLAMDFDGVLTDGHVWTDENGKEMVMASRLDGMGLEMLRRLTDVKACIISKEANPVVSARARKLQVPCFQGVDTGEGKLEILKKIMTEEKLGPEEVIYVGDDVNDVAAMEYAGFGVAVKNAHPQAKKAADYVTRAPGGNGAIRELCDLILAAKKANAQH